MMFVYFKMIFRMTSLNSGIPITDITTKNYNEKEALTSKEDAPTWYLP